MCDEDNHDARRPHLKFKDFMSELEDMAMPWDEFLDSIMVKDLLAQPDYEMALDAYKSAMIERTSHAEPPPEVAGRSPESKITSRYLAPSHPPEGAEGSHLEAVCLQPGVQHLEKHFW